MILNVYLWYQKSKCWYFVNPKITFDATILSLNQQSAIHTFNDLFVVKDLVLFLDTCLPTWKFVGHLHPCTNSCEMFGKWSSLAPGFPYIDPNITIATRAAIISSRGFARAIWPTFPPFLFLGHALEAFFSTVCQFFILRTCTSQL